MYTAALIISVLSGSVAMGMFKMISVHTEEILVQSHRLSAQLPRSCIVHSQSWLVFGDFFSRAKLSAFC